MEYGTAIVWLRRDLRLDDNRALECALNNSRIVLCVYIQPSCEEGPMMGAASRWWLHHSLEELRDKLSLRNIKLVLLSGDPESKLSELCALSQAEAVFWNRCYEPTSVSRDTRIKEELRQRGIDVRSFAGDLLIEPWQLFSKSGTPYLVFTPFWKSLVTKLEDELELFPAGVVGNEVGVEPPEYGLELSDLRLLPQPNWAGGLERSWVPGENSAKQMLSKAIAGVVDSYEFNRDIPSINGTSRLSPHLHFGEISVKRVWQQVTQAISGGEVSQERATCFLRQLAWREFACHLLFHFPETVDNPLKKEFAKFPWESDSSYLRAWQTGHTGYPIVDAGMRELWATGWMHNRVRMICGSFLVKHLLQPWQDGAKWFWDTLVDADLANNTLGWQWIAGCGADAAPYFRVFNPVLQSKKFDASGEYIRRWVKELRDLPAKAIHEPWKASSEHRVSDYPGPIVDLDLGRQRALRAYDKIKRAG